MSDTPILLDSAPGPTAIVNGRRVILLGGTNYLGLAGDPEVAAALAGGATRWGLSSAGSRITTGTAAPHLELESWLRGFLEVETAALAGSAYLGNAIMLQALAERFGAVILDELAHPSLKDAAAAAGLERVTFRHRDAAHARELASACAARGRRPLIATDAVFPTSGLLAPLAEHLETARELGGAVLADDAHGFGVLGERGRGTAEHLGLRPGDFLVSATFSKALGCYGGFVSGPAALGERLARSGAYVGATPLPPALAVAVQKAAALAFDGDALRRRLHENARRLKSGLRALGLEFHETPMPIVQLEVGDAERSRSLFQALFDRGVLIPYIHYPGGPSGGFFRLSASAAHTEKHLDQALAALRSAL
jgi:7-keto-8-aminopelargonate synthetase-like enzyme